VVCDGDDLDRPVLGLATDQSERILARKDTAAGVEASGGKAAWSFNDRFYRVAQLQ
jgi:hypothetical protein